MAQLNLDLFEDVSRWPRRPYCSEDKTARYIRSLKKAMTMPYIQVNPPHLKVRLCFDNDRPGGMFAWEDANLPMPNWGTVNPENAHAHSIYEIGAPVLVDSPDMRQKPLRYLCAIEHAFREKLGADQGYSGLMTRNPSHFRWKVYRGREDPYELAELADWVELPKFIPKRKPEEVGIGRNVTLFDFMRHYAYRNIRHYKWEVKNFVLWQSHLYEKALDRNGDFVTPLWEKEVYHIIRSVSKWTWRQFQVKSMEEDVKWREKQAYRGSKGGTAKGLANEDKRASARLMAAAGNSTRQIAEMLDVNQSTIVRWLR